MADDVRKPAFKDATRVTVDAAYLRNEARNAIVAFAAPLSGVYNAAIGIVQVAQQRQPDGIAAAKGTVRGNIVTQIDVMNASTITLTPLIGRPRQAADV